MDRFEFEGFGPKRAKPDPNAGMAEHLRGLFERFGPSQSRRMFSGRGVFCCGLMAALVLDGRAWFKSGASFAALAKAAKFDPEPFRYARSGKTVALSFSTVPEDWLDDPEAFGPLARASLDDARAAYAAKVPKRKKRSADPEAPDGPDSCA